MNPNIQISIVLCTKVMDPPITTMLMVYRIPPSTLLKSFRTFLGCLFISDKIICMPLIVCIM